MKAQIIPSLILFFSFSATSLFSEVQPKHGGFVFEVGHHVGYLEVVHKAHEGAVNMYFYNIDNLTPVALDKPPRINLDTKDGRQQVKTSVVQNSYLQLSQFYAKSDLLKGQVKGEIAIKLRNRYYLIKF